jgi:hypothetical protein
MARDDDDYDDDTPDDRPAKPRARVTGLTLALILLNLLAAPGFLVLMVLDYQARQEWSFAAFRNVAAVWGLPLQDEDEYLLGGLANETRPRMRLGAEQLKKTFSERRGKGSPDFDAVDEAIPFRIAPSQLTAEIKSKLFEGIGDPVDTVEAEVNRLKGRVPTDIEEKAKEVAEKYKGKTDAEKRAAVEAVLLPLAWSTDLVEKLHQLIQTKQGADLDAFLTETVQRRLYADILAPLNLQRPGGLQGREGGRPDLRPERPADAAGDAHRRRGQADVHPRGPLRQARGAGRRQARRGRPPPRRRHAAVHAGPGPRPAQR